MANDLDVALSDDGTRILYLHRGRWGDEHELAAFETYDVATGKILDRTPATEDAIQQLAQRLAAEVFWAMAPLEAHPDRAHACRAPPPQTVDSNGLQVRFAFPQLVVVRQGETLLSADLSSWTASAQDPSCVGANPLVLDALWLDEARTAMGVVLAYCGGDVCSEPADRFLVVRLGGWQ